MDPNFGGPIIVAQIVTAYMQKVAAEQARQQAGQQAGAALSAVTIVENN